MKRWMTAAVALLAMASGVCAQIFPSRVITVVVPYAAGGAMDAMGRVFAEAMQQSFHSAVIVDNRAGANGVLGMNYVAKAEPDGHTLMISSETGQAIQPAIDPSFILDSLNTFMPISLLGTFPHFLVVRKSLGVNSVAELLAYAKAHPGKLNFGNNGIGTIAHVGIEVLKRKAGIDAVNVPYRGSMAAFTDLLGGAVDANIQSLPVLAGQMDNPLIKILAILSGERDKRFPNIPTMVESGVPDFVFVSWTAMFGPPAMPKQLVTEISSVLQEAARTNAVRDRMHTLGFEAVGSDAETLDHFQRSVAATWKRIAQETGVRVDQ
jgi:tripartite-type tricarboxylate transporter receptor subunit TctC